MRRRLAALVVLALAAPAFAQGTDTFADVETRVAAPPTDLPAGFYTEDAASGASFTAPVDVAAAPDGRLFVAQKNGVVAVVQDGVKLAAPFLDLSAEVLNSGDRGLLGIALDPAFATTGHVYLLYTVDVGGADGQRSDAFGRLARYTASAADPNRADPASRRVLLGETFATGPAACSPSHAPATLRFGSDGTLLVGTGDGASFSEADGGGLHPACFGPGRLDPAEDVGAFRSLALTSLAGKVLRIDPATGAGLPSNPFYTGDPADVASKVWAYGLRNPFRFAVLPDGDPTPATGRPGTVVVGDVGWVDVEEMTAVTGGEGLGWPCFEGPSTQADYWAGPFPAVSCTDALAPLGPQTPPGAHWHHRDPGLSSPPGRRANAIVGGDVYRGTAYPAAYQGAVFYADYVRGWMAVGRVGADGVFSEQQAFSQTTGPVVDVEYDAATETLLFVDIGAGKVLRLRHDADGTNDAPVAVAAASPPQGPAPLTVQFTGSGSSDPEGGTLAFAWAFGDGATSPLPDPKHTYATPGTYPVTLTVTDAGGASGQATLTVVVGTGAGPVARIVAPADGAWAPVGASVGLRAAPEPGVDLAWEVVQVHADHEHGGTALATGPEAEFVVPAHGGPDEVVYYVVRLTATDAEGLVDVAEHRLYVAPSATGLPAPWAGGDVGSVPVAGVASGAGDAITVHGGGTLDGTADGFQFARRPLGGDGVLTARVADLVCGFPWAKVGLMVRETLAPESPHVAVVAVEGDGVRLQYRAAWGAPMAEAASTAGAVPVWLRLERDGDGVVASTSDDGATWTVLGAVTVPMHRGLHAGLVASATDPLRRGLVAHGVFTDVALGPGLGGPAGPLPDDGLPAPWVGEDVGVVAAAGTATHAAGTFRVEGAGDVWGTDDGFHYVHQPLDGDGTLTARVADLVGADPWAKAGLMVRGSLAPGAPHAVVVATPGEGVHLQYRAAPDGPMQSVAGPDIAAPVWLRMERVGTVVRAWSSADGAAWQAVGAVSLPLPTVVRAGLMATGTDRDGSGQLAAATFDGVVLEPADPSDGTPLPSPWTAVDLGAVALAGASTTDGTQIQVEGAGDVWGTTDAFQFAYQRLEGTSSITARLVGVEGAQGWAKAGLMVRADLTPGSPHAMLVGTVAEGVHLQARAAAGAATTSAEAPLGAGGGPVWLRLARVGTTVSASVSADGAVWLDAGDVTLPLGAAAYVGLMATGTDYADRGDTGTGTFEAVTVTGVPPATGSPVAEEAAPAGAFALEAVFPNPFHGRATARVATATAGPLAVEVLDLLGRRVLTREVTGRPGTTQDVALDLTGQSAGAYVVVARELATGATAHRRVLLVR